MQFKPFYNDWLDCSELFDYSKKPILQVDLPQDFFKNLKFDKDSIRSYRMNAARRTAESLGDNPALCLSGGIDSQCMLQAWQEADLKFEAYTLVFDDHLNWQDVSHAREFCKWRKIKLNEIPFNVVSFLTRENFDYGLKYKCASPHFNVHYKMFELLRDMGYTGVCCGGGYLMKNNSVWGENLTANQMNFINFSSISTYPAQGSFLSFDPELTWVLSLLANALNIDYQFKNPYKHVDQNDIDSMNKIRYESKVMAYKRAGFDIIEQDKKYTGFEYVKEYFAKRSGDGWEFERRFRHPLEKLILVSQHTPNVSLNQQHLQDIESILKTTDLAI